MAVAPFAAVLPGCERFAAGLPRESLAALWSGGFSTESFVEVCPTGSGNVRGYSWGRSPRPLATSRVALVAHALRRAGAERITAVLPYLAYARQDRARRTESLGLAWVGELLRASGIGEVACVDVHSEQGAEVLGLPLMSLSPASLFGSALTHSWCSDTTFVAATRGRSIERPPSRTPSVWIDRSFGRASAGPLSRSSISDWSAHQAIGPSSSLAAVLERSRQ